MSNECPTPREILDAIFARMNALPLHLRQMVDNGTLELWEAEKMLMAISTTVH
jgi:hypothetical protein